MLKGFFGCLWLSVLFAVCFACSVYVVSVSPCCRSYPALGVWGIWVTVGDGSVCQCAPFSDMRGRAVVLWMVEKITLYSIVNLNLLPPSRFQNSVRVGSQKLFTFRKLSTYFLEFHQLWYGTKQTIPMLDYIC